MTQPVTTIESAEQIAERLLPCQSDCVDRTCHGCLYRPSIAAALRAERERALEEAAKLIESTRYLVGNNYGYLIRAIDDLRALAQKGDR